MLRGIDVSHYQADLSDNMAAIKRKGAAFVIVKATQDTWTDSAFGRLLAGARSAGMVVGAYHFLVEPENGGGQSPAAQATAFVKAVKAANRGTLDGVLLALDVEPFKRSSPSWADVRAWVATFRKLAGADRPLFIYTRAGVWASFKNPRIRPALGSRTYLWSADWTAKAGGAWGRGYGGIKPIIHQHGPFPGTRPRIVDGNVFNGTVAQLRSYTRPKVEDPPDPDPTPDPEPAEVGDRWSLRLMGAPLLPGEGLDPVAAAAYGVPLLVETGRIGAGTGPGGSPSPLYAVAIALAGRRLDPPLLVAVADLGATPPPSIPASEPRPLPAAGPPL